MSFFYSLLFLFLGSVFAVLFTSYTQTAEAGLNRLAIKYPGYKTLLKHWTPRWNRLRSVLLFLAVVFQISSVVVTTHVLQSLWPKSIPLSIGLAFAYVLLYTLAFRIMPRVLAESNSDRLSIATLRPIRLLSNGLIFISWPVAQLESQLMTIFLSGSDEENRPSTEDEILTLVEQSDEQELEEEEREIIRSVLDFADTVVREIMTPRVNVQGIEAACTVNEAMQLFKDSRHSRLPVFDESIDNVRGMLHVKDVLRLISENKSSTLVAEAMLEVPFVPESKPINDLLKLLQSEQVQTAIVVDEYGGTAGLVTIEDIVEELVGEIEDEYDQNPEKIQLQADGSALVDATISVNDLNEALDMAIPEKEEYDSIGGYIYYCLGRIPSQGEIIEGDDHQITVREASERQLIRIQVLKKETQSA